MKNNSGPAFPVPDQYTANGEPISQGCFGMSLRDYFAAKAMQAMLNTELRRDMWASVEKIAIDAYKQADAMLKVRESE